MNVKANDQKSTLLLLILHTVELVDPRAEVCRVAAERDLERGKELVHTGQQRLWWRGSSGNGGLAFKHDDAVCKVSRHDEIVLDDERRLLCVQDEALDDFAGNDTLLGVKEANYTK